MKRAKWGRYPDLCKLRLFVASVVLAVLVLVVAGCSRQTQTQAPKRIPQRIVSISPSSTEILFALGLGDKVVGVTSRCNYPPEAKAKPKVGDMNATIERVIAQKPDLVLAESVVNDAAILKLRNLGIRVLAISPKTYEEVIRDIKLVGRETGAEKRASAVATDMESAVKSARGAAKGHPEVLVVVQSNPLWTAGPKTFVDDMLGYIGAKNIGRDTSPGKFSQMPTETAIARNPDVIIVTLASDKTYFETNSIWKNINAVRNHRIYVIDPDLICRDSPRLAKGLDEMARVVKESSR